MTKYHSLIELAIYANNTTEILAAYIHVGVSSTEEFDYLNQTTTDDTCFYELVNLKEFTEEEARMLLIFVAYCFSE